MTDRDDMHSLLLTEVRDGEPAFTLSSDEVIVAGRRRLRAQRVGYGLAACALVTAGAVGGVGLTGGWVSPFDNQAPVASAPRVPAANQDPQKMPAIIDDAVRASFPEGLGEPASTEIYPRDVNGARLSMQELDRLDTWVAKYTWSGHDHLTVALDYSESDTEGDPQKECGSGLASGYDITCQVSTPSAGTTVLTRIGAAELQKGDFFGVQNHQALADKSNLWFDRSVEAQRGGTYGVWVYDRVKAASLDQAEQRWRLAPSDLQRISLHPDLVFPNTTTS